MPLYRLYIETNKVYTSEELGRVAERVEDLIWEEDVDQKSGYVSVTAEFD